MTNEAEELKKYLNSLRNALGILGFLLPPSTLFFNLKFGYENPLGVLTSISATHYSSGYILFEGLVLLTAGVLMCYRGYDIKDRIVTKLAGLGAILLVVFPCALEGARTWNFMMLPQGMTNTIHLASAGLFFASLVFMIAFQFTKTGEGSVIQPKSRKWRRNILYRVCAVLMVVGLAIGFGGKALFGWKYSVFAGEWVALWSFSPAWLTKGNSMPFLRDI